MPAASPINRISNFWSDHKTGKGKITGFGHEYCKEGVWEAGQTHPHIYYGSGPTGHPNLVDNDFFFIVFRVRCRLLTMSREKE